MELFDIYKEMIVAILAAFAGWFLKALRLKGEVRKMNAESLNIEHGTFTSDFELIVRNLREQLTEEIDRRKRLDTNIKELKSVIKRLEDENNTLRGALERINASYNTLVIEFEKWKKAAKGN